MGASVGGINLGPGTPYSVTLDHEGVGYGFTVRGSCPTRVGRIREHGPAQQAGIQRGDYILNINATNVTRSGAESVAAMVKVSSESMSIDLFRRNPRSKSSSSYQSSFTSSRASSLPSVDLNYAIIEPDVNDENRPPSRHLNASHHLKSEIMSMTGSLKRSLRDKTSSEPNDSLKRNVIGSSCKDIVIEHAVIEHAQDVGNNNTQLQINRVHELQGGSPKPWDNEISPIGKTASKTSLKNVISVPSLSRFENSKTDISQISDTSWNEDVESAEDGSYMEDYATSNETELPWNPDCTGDFTNNLQNFRDESVLSENSIPSSPNTPFGIRTNSISSPLTLSQPALELQQLEQDFSEMLQAVVLAYSRPLRHCSLSLRLLEHQQLFQNMEKMAAISSFIAKQLKCEAPAKLYFSRVSGIIVVVSFFHLIIL